MLSFDGQALLVKEYPGLASPDPQLRRAAFMLLVGATTGREVSNMKTDHPVLHEHLLQQAVGDAFCILWEAVETPGSAWQEKWSWDYFRGILRNKGRGEYFKFKKARGRFGKHQRKEVEMAEDLAVYGTTLPQFAEREQQSNSLKIVDAVINGLPVQQRRVAEILRDNRDAKIGTKEVIELYRKAHGATLTPAAAKSSMAVVRTKLRAALKQIPVD